MKLHTNFAPPLGRWALPTAVLLWTVTAGFLVGAGVLWAHRAAMEAELPVLAAQQQRLVERRGAPEVAALPTPDALADLRRRVARLNALLAPSPPPLPEALTALEGSLPLLVRLVSLRVDPDGRSLVILAEAPSDADIPALLQKLESAPVFCEVRLVQQQEVGAHERRTVRAEIRATWPRG